MKYQCAQDVCPICRESWRHKHFLSDSNQKMAIKLKGPPGIRAFNGNAALVHPALFSLSCLPWPGRTSSAFRSRAIDFFLPQSHSTPQLFALQMKPEEYCPAQSCRGNKSSKKGYRCRPLGMSPFPPCSVLPCPGLRSHKREDHS